MRIAILLFCSVFLLGQSTPPTPAPNPEPPAETADGKSQNQKLDLRASSQGCGGGLDVLSDMQGVDFGPYLQLVLSRVRENWYGLIPDSVKPKKGNLAIEFAITKDGQVADMRLVAKSGDIALDRPAWGSITASNPFPPLPSEFTGPFLALRVRFCYNPDTKAKSGIAAASRHPPICMFRLEGRR